MLKEKEKFNKDYSQTTLESCSAEVLMKLNAGCECNNVSCFDGLDPETVYRHRLNIAELTKNEIDFYLMGICRAALIDPSDRGAKRQRKRSSYSYMGKKVCLYAFLYLENITIYQLKKIRSHVVNHGVVAVEHGNSHKTPHNAFSLDLYKRAENFLRRYLNANKQPHSSKCIVLNQPLSKVYQEYKDEEAVGSKFMGYTTFRTFFKKQFPNVRLHNQVVKAHPPSSSHQQITIVEESLFKSETAEPVEIICTNTDDLIYYEEESSHDEVVIGS